jgi:peroxiredoxin
MIRTSVKFLTLLLLLTVNLAYSQEKKNTNIVIDGKLTGETNQPMIYLEALTTTAEIIDSAKITPNGKFSIKTSLKETGFFKLRLDKENYLILILQPKEKVQIEASALKLSNNVKISGSWQTELMYKTVGILSQFNGQLDSLNNIYLSARESGTLDAVVPMLKKKFEEIDNQQKNILAEMMIATPNSLSWLFFIDKLDINKYADIYMKVDSALMKQCPDNLIVHDFHAKVEDSKFLSPGSTAPEIMLPDQQGELKKLSSLRGNIVLIDFWASWCSPCRQENPNVVKMFNKYHSKGFEIFSVSLDKTKENWLKAINDDKLTWTQVSDLLYWKSEAALKYHVTSIPFTVLIDKEGKIIAKGLRGESLEKKLSELLD